MTEDTKTKVKPETDGYHLRTLRYRRGWTIADVADRLKDQGREIHENHLRNIEAGRKNASAPLLFALAAVLGTKVDELLVSGTK